MLSQILIDRLSDNQQSTEEKAIAQSQIYSTFITLRSSIWHFIEGIKDVHLSVEGPSATLIGLETSRYGKIHSDSIDY